MDSRRNFKKYLFESPSVMRGEEEELKRSDFDFEKRLGEGAFGQVWHVRHKNTDKRFALKIVPKDKVLKMLSQFRREVFIMYELDHPHIIKLYNHFEDDKYFYLIMELASGGNMFHKLYREKQFIERVAAQYFREVVLAVEYLHSHVPAIIHRDIKPENILLDKDSRVKLTDFGWSNYYSPEKQAPRTTVCGTLEYLPPEMVDRKGHDTAADIWCLGVLLFEMLVGYTPFKASGKDIMLSNITRIKPKFPMSFPPLARDLINRMLQKDPKDRITITEVKEHRWMLEHPPIRDTITQETVSIVLPDLNTVDNLAINKGYKVINQTHENTEPAVIKTPKASKVPEKKFEEKKSEDEKTPTKISYTATNSTPSKTPTQSQTSIDNLSIPDEKTMIIKIPTNLNKYANQISPIPEEESTSEFYVEKKPKVDKAIRESIKQIQEQVKFTQGENQAAKEKMSFQNAEIEVSLEAIKELEKRISDKRANLKELTNANKILSCQISDKALELDTIENSYNHQDISSKINERKTRYMELQSECKMKKKYLESIEAQVHSYTVHIAEKEKDINSLQYQRDRLRHESKSANSQVKSQIAELEINAEILRSRIDNYERLNTEMSEDDSRIAVDIINLMKEKMRNLKGIPEAEVQTRLETIREQIMEKEQRITELTLEYQDKKYKLTQELRRQKETLTRELREKYDQANRESRVHIDELKKALKDKLEDSRSKEQKLSVESNDIGECRKLLMVRINLESKSYFLTDTLRGRTNKKRDIRSP